MEQAGHPDVGQPDVSESAFVLDSEKLPRDTLATRIARKILKSIRVGDLAIGSRLPSEPKLAEIFGVGRNTLREAIQLLVAQGVLESRKGIGTFVRSSGFSLWPVETGIEMLASTTEIISSAGHVPGCRSFQLDIVAGPDEVTNALQIDQGLEVYRLSRVRLADDTPVILCVDYLPRHLVFEADMRQFDGQGSLFAFLADQCSLTIEVARAVLKPLLAGDAIAEALEVSSNEPLLLLKQTHFDAENQPFLYSENYVNSTLFGYHVRRMPAAFFAAHPAHRLGSADGQW